MKSKPAENSGVFLSFYQGSDKSRAIVGQLDEFFKNWGLDCYVIERIEGTEPPRHTMIERLSKSRFLLQLFTDHRNVRKWMQWEWDMAQALWQASGSPMSKPRVLHTSETDLKDKTFKAFRDGRDEGHIDTFNLDEEKSVRRLLGSILVELGRLPKDHGPIELPTFCQPSVVAEPITLEMVEDFIRNFRGASVKGLECVFSDREALLPRLKQRLVRLGQDRDTIRMLGFTLKRYVLPTTRRNDVGSLFKAAIDKGAKAKLLLLNRECRAAKERARIESPGVRHEKSLLYGDSREVCESYPDGGKVEIQYYRTPYVGLIIFEDEAYVEIYHLGKEIQDRDICGRVPILVVKPRGGAGLYELFESHFTSVWPRPDIEIPAKPLVSPRAIRQPVSKGRQVSIKKHLRLQRGS